MVSPAFSGAQPSLMETTCDRKAHSVRHCPSAVTLPDSLLMHWLQQRLSSGRRICSLQESAWLRNHQMLNSMRWPGPFPGVIYVSCVLIAVGRPSDRRFTAMEGFAEKLMKDTTAFRDAVNSVFLLLLLSLASCVLMCACGIKPWSDHQPHSLKLS